MNNRNQPIPCTDLPEHFYHATDYPFVPGDVILPGREVELAHPFRERKPSRGHFVWMSPAPIAGWGGRIYEVEPLGPVEEARSWYRTTRARVIAQVGGGAS